MGVLFEVQGRLETVGVVVVVCVCGGEGKTTTVCVCVCVRVCVCVCVCVRVFQRTGSVVEAGFVYKRMHELGFSRCKAL